MSEVKGCDLASKLSIADDLASKLRCADEAFAKSRKASRERAKAHLAWMTAEYAHEETENVQNSQACSEAKTALENAVRACRTAKSEESTALIHAQTAWHRQYRTDVYEINKNAGISELTIARDATYTTWEFAQMCYDSTTDKKRAFHEAVKERHEKEQARLKNEEN